MGEIPWILAKKNTVVPVSKKESNNLPRNYRPASLILIFGKSLKEWYLRNYLFIFIKMNNLLNTNLAFLS